MTPTLRILIVDDDQRMTRTLKDILSLDGHEVVESTSGLDALEKLRTQAFDCLLTDVRMPGMDGVELHERLRKERPGLPVVLMTAYAADQVIQKGLDQGIVGVLNKPLDISHLLGFFASLAKQHTIAIVDDDPAFCKTLGEILQQRGFTVTQVNDPHMDADLFASNSQAILLDMKLNSVNGLDVLRSIRERYPSVPVMLVTGYRQEMAETIQTALNFSAFTCLYKPLEIQDLLEKLTSLQLDHLRSMISTK